MFRRNNHKKNTNVSLSLQLAVLSAYFALTVAKFIEFTSVNTNTNFLLDWNNGSRLADKKYFDPIVNNIKNNPDKFTYPSTHHNGIFFYKEADLCRELNRGNAMHTCSFLDRQIYKTSEFSNVGFGFYHEKTRRQSWDADRESIKYVMDMIDVITKENEYEIYSAAYKDAGLKFLLFGLTTMVIVLLFLRCMLGGQVVENNERRHRRD